MHRIYYSFLACILKYVIGEQFPGSSAIMRFKILLSYM